MRPRHHHLADASSLGWAEARKLASGCSGINRKTAIVVPAVLGSMVFFWVANVLALCSLPAVTAAFDHEVLKDAIGLTSFFPSVIEKVSLIALIAWLAQTYIQLVALPVLQVSNNAQMAQAEAHAEEILQGVKHAEDLLSLETAGGLRDVRNDLAYRLEEIEKLVKQQPPPPAPAGFEPRVPQTPPPANRPTRPVRPSK